MSHAYRITDQEAAFFLTFQIVGWVDLFTRRKYRDILLESLQYCQQNKGLLLYAYVVMSNHVHLLVQSKDGNLSGFIRDFKSFTSRNLLQEMKEGVESRKDWMEMVFNYHGKTKTGQTYQLWTHENHAVELYSLPLVTQRVNYIHENPVRSGIVANVEDYLYSSASNYAGLGGLLDVIVLDLKAGCMGGNHSRSL